jgi:hypothetical protein
MGGMNHDDVNGQRIEADKRMEGARMKSRPSAYPLREAIR